MRPEPPPRGVCDGPAHALRGAGAVVSAVARRWVLGAALTLSCVAAPAVEPPPGEGQAPITAGTPSTGDPAVVAVVFGGAVLCSGTLIHPRVVVTAAHCIHQQLAVFFGTGREAGRPPLHQVALAIAHPGFVEKTLDNDIGLLLLEEPAPASVPPVRLYQGPFDDTLVGRKVRLVGFGWNHLADPPFGVKNTGEATIDSYAATRFDMVASPAATCGGDSGGAGLLVVDGAEQLAGVTSAGDEDCKNLSRHTRVDAFREPFILPFLEKAREGSVAAGERCYFDAQCAGGRCLAPSDAPKFRYCADACRRTADCPGGMACEPASEGGPSVCRYPMPSPGALGGACQSNEDCASKLCAGDRSSARRTCSIRCVDGLIPCDPGFACREIGASQSACFPDERLELGGGACAIDAHGGRSAQVFVLLAALLSLSRRRKSRQVP